MRTMEYVKALKGQLMNMRHLATELGKIDAKAEEAWNRLDVEQALCWERAAYGLVSNRRELAEGLSNIENALVEVEVPVPNPRWVEPPWLKKERGVIIDELMASIFGYQYEAFAHFSSGLDLCEEGRLADAVDELSRAIAMEPRMTGAYIERGRAYGKMGEYNKAIDDFDEALRMCPGSAGVYQQRGIMWAQLGDFHTAKLDLDEAIYLDPGNASAYSCRGNVHEELGEHEQAL